MSLIPLFVTNFDAAEREGVECVQRAIEQLGGEVIAGQSQSLMQTIRARMRLWMWLALSKEWRAPSLRGLP